MSAYSLFGGFIFGKYPEQHQELYANLHFPNKHQLDISSLLNFLVMQYE